MTEEDEAAFDEFLAARSTALLRTAILVCGASPHDAEDLVQNALEKIYRHWSRIRHDNPESYARRVVVNAAIDVSRRRRVIQEITFARSPETAVVPPVEVPRAIKMTVAEARAVLEAAGLTASVEGETAEAGLVVEQTPDIGESVPHGSTVRLVAIDPARPAPSSTTGGSEERTAMPQDLGDLGDGRAFGGVRFGYLPDGLEWGKWSGKNGFGTTSYTRRGGGRACPRESTTSRPWSTGTARSRS
ncbi:PASTA domain-containing protein [Streptosporangium sp. NPDC023615]|uniref:PASTA domain-containing protein n=1 Tax=Streptosporangium sp. NPDC023615 TaxID=3154794 RepID=UPI003415E3B5